VTAKGLLICSSIFDAQLRAFGSDLALLSPATLFMAHKWINATCLRPQTHACVWLGAVSVFRPLWVHHDLLLEAVVKEMHTSDDEAAEDIAWAMGESSEGSSVASEATARLKKNCFKSRNFPANIASITFATTFASLSHP